MKREKKRVYENWRIDRERVMERERVRCRMKRDSEKEGHGRWRKREGKR